jgi:phosphoadenylyl-sulfate reductase (thioredoxin)
MPAFDVHGAPAAAWPLVADADPPTATGPALASPARLCARREPGLGLLLEPDADLAPLAGLISTLERIAIRFASFKDGRPFSLARILRSRFGFAGDLRALGAIIPDQAGFLVRCGFTSFEVAEGFDIAAFQRALRRFPLVYQRPWGAAGSIMERRHAAVSAAARLHELRARYSTAAAFDLLAAAVTREFPGRIALVSSFGAESAVLLHMLSRIAPDAPVLFLDTGKLFGETLRYRNALTALLGLRNVQTITPDPAAVAARDGNGVLWSKAAEACCVLRKVEPLARALAPYDAWVTGRKRHQSAERHDLPLIEHVDGRFKFNPLAAWTRADLAAYLDTHRLPRHPLEADGYLSIGCTPCTDRVRPGEDARAGRWRDSAKTECGIHHPAPLRVAS